MSAFSSQFPDWFQPIGLYAGVCLALFGLLASIWHWVNNHRLTNGKAALRVGPTHVIIIGLLVAAIGVFWQWYRPPIRDQLVNSGATKGAEALYLENISLPAEALLSKSSQDFVRVQGKIKTSGERLKIVLEQYSGPSPILISEIEGIRGEMVDVALVSTTYVESSPANYGGEVWRLQAGGQQNPKGRIELFGTGNPMMFRVRIIGPDNKEQQKYFMLSLLPAPDGIRNLSFRSEDDLQRINTDFAAWKETQNQ